MAIGLMEWVIMPLIGTPVKVILGAILWLIIDAVNALMTWICTEFTSTFVIGESMFTNEVYKAVTGGETYTLLRAVALSGMVVIAIWQIVKANFAFIGLNEVEEPWRIGMKVLTFGILIVYSRDICELVLKMAGAILSGILEINLVIKNGKVIGTSIAETAFKATANINFWSLEDNNLLMVILQAVIIIYVNYKMIGFMFNITQKYLNMMVYVAIAPIALACGVSRATSDILKSWTRLFAGGIAIQGVQFLILKFIDVYGQLLGDTTADWSVLFLYFSLGAIVGKLEEILGEMGLPGGVKFEILGSLRQAWGILKTAVKVIIKIFL